MVEINSNRKHDDNQERIINEFLFDNFFKKVNSSAKLIFDYDLQTHGVDVQMNSKSGKTVNIDIKTQSSAKYINDPRPTFILELSSFDRYGIKPFVGWFLSEESITDFYTFVWIHSATVNEKFRITSVDDIHKVEVLTVSKQKLKEYVTSVLKDTDIDTIINEMRDNEETRRNIINGMHFSHSPQLPEKPVNIVVHKRILKMFSKGDIGHCYVTKDGIYKIKDSLY